MGGPKLTSIEVQGCSTCPFAERSGRGPSCRHPEGPLIPLPPEDIHEDADGVLVFTPGPPAARCPPRMGSTMVSL